VRPKTLHLPTHEQFRRFVEAIGTAAAWCSRDRADLVCFPARGGFRKGEAAAITWGDCDFERDEILVRGDAVPARLRARTSYDGIGSAVASYQPGYKSPSAPRGTNVDVSNGPADRCPPQPADWTGPVASAFLHPVAAFSTTEVSTNRSGIAHYFRSNRSFLAGVT